MRSSQKRPAASPAHILLLATNQSGLKARKILLEEKGYQVTATSKVRDAAAVLEQGAPSLVITDYKTDQQNGIDFLSRTRALHESTPLVLLVSPLDEASADLSGCCADLVVTKNAHEINQLLRGVERLLNRKPRKRPTSIRAPRAQKEQVQG